MNAQASPSRVDWKVAQKWSLGFVAMAVAYAAVGLLQTSVSYESSSNEVVAGKLIALRKAYRRAEYVGLAVLRTDGKRVELDCNTRFATDCFPNISKYDQTEVRVLLAQRLTGGAVVLSVTTSSGEVIASNSIFSRQTQRVREGYLFSAALLSTVFLALFALASLKTNQQKN